MFGIRQTPRLPALFLLYLSLLYLQFAIPISHNFNTFIMSEGGNLPVHLGHDTSIDTIWDFEIQGMENQASLSLIDERSDDSGSPSMSALSSAPSGLLTPKLVKN